MLSTAKRQSAAVMFTDIAEYAEIMASNKEKALSLLQEKRKILKPLIKEYDGVYVNSPNDGTLSYFDSAYKATKCAKLFQESIYNDDSLNVRVGIHFGDIVNDKGNIYGDGVDIASRLKSMSPVGGICVSDTVYNELSKKKEFEGIELGLQSIQGVGRLIEVFGLKGDMLTVPNPKEYQENKVTVHSDDEVPSVAIIPFDNKGADEDVFYAYGISADLISDCSRAGLIRVAGLKEIEELGDISFKKKAKKLNVRYIATGSLWKMDDIFQLSIELYDTKESKILWSDRWQEEWINLPIIKDKLTDGVLKTLDFKPIEQKKLTTNSSICYELYLRGKYIFEKRRHKADINIALKLMKDALKEDNNFLPPKIFTGFIYSQIAEFDKALNILQECLILSKSNAKKNEEYEIYLNMLKVYIEKGDYDKAFDILDMAKTLIEKNQVDYNKWDYYLTLGKIFLYKGDYEKSIDAIEKASQYIDKPNESHRYITLYNHYTICYNFLRKYRQAFQFGFKALELAKETKTLWFEGKIWNNIAVGHRHLGLYQNALEYYENSIEICEKINDYG